MYPGVAILCRLRSVREYSIAQGRSTQRCRRRGHSRVFSVPVPPCHCERAQRASLGVQCLGTALKAAPRCRTPRRQRGRLLRALRALAMTERSKPPKTSCYARRRPSFPTMALPHLTFLSTRVWSSSVPVPRFPLAQASWPCDARASLSVPAPRSPSARAWAWVWVSTWGHEWESAAGCGLASCELV